MIFGSYLYDVSNISAALSRLKCNHIVVGSQLSQYKTVTVSPTQQPHKVYVVDGLQRVFHLLTEKSEGVVIVCDAKSALLNSNVNKELLFHHFTNTKLLSALTKALRKPEFQELVISEPTLQEVIDKVTTKSILTDIQTLVNKVNPYSLRKKVHKYVISYLYGAMPYKKVVKFLATVVKLDPIKDIVTSKAAKNIRNAVMEYIKTKDEESVSKQFGVHTFEILYVFNSYDRLGDSDDRM